MWVVSGSWWFGWEYLVGVEYSRFNFPAVVDAASILAAEQQKGMKWTQTRTQTRIGCIVAAVVLVAVLVAMATGGADREGALGDNSGGDSARQKCGNAAYQSYYNCLKSFSPDRDCKGEREQAQKQCLGGRH